jgi:hypothetical protein
MTGILACIASSFCWGNKKIGEERKRERERRKSLIKILCFIAPFSSFSLSFSLSLYLSLFFIFFLWNELRCGAVGWKEGRKKERTK